MPPARGGKSPCGESAGVGSSIQTLEQRRPTSCSVMTRSCARRRKQPDFQKCLICRVLLRKARVPVRATVAQTSGLPRLSRQHKLPICRAVVNGSDGTRTRDLRRDRPTFSQAIAEPVLAGDKVRASPVHHEDAPWRCSTAPSTEPKTAWLSHPRPSAWGRTKNPAYRPATEKPWKRGFFYFTVPRRLSEPGPPAERHRSSRRV